MFGETDSECRNETDGIIGKENRNEGEIRNQAEDACETIRTEGETTSECETTSEAENKAMSTGTRVPYSSGEAHCNVQGMSSDTDQTSQVLPPQKHEVIVNTALLERIEALNAENARFRACDSSNSYWGKKTPSQTMAPLL